jgi:hypothetical protein
VRLPRLQKLTFADPSATILVTDYETENKSKKNQEPEGDDVDVDADANEQVIVTPASEEPPTAPSPDDQIRQITQSSTRVGHDIKPVVNDDRHQMAPSEDLDFIPMIDEEDKQMMDRQAAFEIDQQLASRSTLMPMTTSQSHPALTVDTQNLYGFKNGSKVGHRSTHHHGSMRQKQLSRRDLQQQQEMMLMQSWPNGDIVSGGPNSSPSDFLPVEYTFNGAQCHTPIPNQTFRMAEAALSSMTDGTSSMDMALSATTATPNGLLLGDAHHLPMHHSTHFAQQFPHHSGSTPTPFMHSVGIPYHGMSRPIPTRTMSSASHHHQVGLMDAQHHQQMAAAAAVAAAAGHDMYFPS